MSRTPGTSSDGDSVGVPGAVIDDGDDSPAHDSGALRGMLAGVLAREAAAAAEAGDSRRADALICARALLAENSGDQAGARALWRSAFDRDPTLLVAFWGLRRALHRRAAWDELLVAVERRMAAVVSPNSPDNSPDDSPELASAGGEVWLLRAELWVEHGRLLEDRLGRDDDAVRSYRAGLLEAPDHPGLLTSLLLLGLRRGDGGATAEALSGLLRRPLPQPLRASLSAFLARIERGVAAGPSEHPSLSSGVAAGPPHSVDPAAAQRALETLRDALRAVGPRDAAPLVAELGVLARAARDPATRVEILDELVTHLPRLPGATAGDGSSVEDGVGNRELAASFLRERARLLRDHLRQPDAARTALRAALLLVPAHPVVLADLSDLIEVGAGRRAEVAARELGDLLALVAPNKKSLDSEAERDLAVRTVTALAAAGRWQEGLELLEGHPELPRLRADLFALELLLRAGAGDRSRLATMFEGVAREMASRPWAAEAAAHALVVAGTLREREDRRGQGQGRTRDQAARSTAQSSGVGTGRDNAEAAALRLYGRALALAPGYTPAHDAVERRLWAAGRWEELGAVLEHRLRQLAEAARAPHRAPAASVPPQNDDTAAERTRILEELVALRRDRAVDLVAARRHQDQLIATSGGGDVRAWVRRCDLQLTAVANDGAAVAAKSDTVAVLRALADRVDGTSHVASPVAAALRVEGARTAVRIGDRAAAEELLRQAVPSDLAGTATSTLERLLVVSDDQGRNRRADAHADVESTRAAASADLVRAELAGVLAREGRAGKDSNSNSDSDRNRGAGSTNADRVRALRFRVAWHELWARRPSDALDTLRPLRVSGDVLARAWSWEIARRHGDPQAQLAVLQSAPPGPHSGLVELPTDLAEALERAGDLPAAEAGFREAQRKEASTDGALGLLRVGAALGNAAVVLEATRDLAAQADQSTVGLLSQEVALLGLLQPTPDQAISGAASGGPADGGGEQGGQPWRQSGGVEATDDDPMKVVLRWVAGTRGTDVLAAAAGLLALGRALPYPSASATSESATDSNGLLARAAARARLGGVALAGAVHDQVVALSAGAAPIGVGLADLPVSGRPERMAARVARAERNGGLLAYALDLERALDCESRGDGAGALEAFGQALRRDSEGLGLEALVGIKRLALATGDRLGAARAGARLGAVLRTPARAAAEFGMAAQLWEELAMPAEAQIAYWQALARDPASEWLYERLRELLLGRGDGAALDRLYGHRLAALTDPRARLTLLGERAQHRLEQLQDRTAAIEDFKRILNIDPGHPLALRRLATLALQMEYFAQAVRFLERLLGGEPDESTAAALRLELAEALEAARDTPRAIEVLRRAASVRPRDVAPWERLTDLLLRVGDWEGALATLRSWDTVLADPGARAAIWLRIGCLLRDHGRDAAGAAAAFTTASDLDPLGDGLRELLALTAAGGTTATAPRTLALRNAIEALRQRVAEDPLDVRTLRRLKDLYEWSAVEDVVPDAAGGAMVAGQLLSLAGEDAELFPGRRRELRGILPVEFWARLRAPGGAGLVAELWPIVGAGITRLAPPGTPAMNPREGARIAPRSEPRLAWVESAAGALGLPALELWMATAASPGRRRAMAVNAADASDESVVPLEGERPGLFLGRGILTGNASARFRVGRALLLLRERATAMERLSVAELGTFMAAVAVVAGAGTAPIGAPRMSKGIEDRARALGKAMSRKDRKALELEASRLASQPADPGPFRKSLLSTADRLGLVLAGDIAVAVRVAGEFVLDPEIPLTTAALAISPHHERVLDLVRFAVSDDYLALRRDAGLEEA
ncbi:MAG: tetratricopeptide repeat protein [Myxococcales bacterium]